MTPERDQRLLAQANAISGVDVVRLLELVAAALEATANGAQARIQLELVLIKAAAPEIDPSTKALLARIERLESALAQGIPARPPAPPPRHLSPDRLRPGPRAARPATRAHAAAHQCPTRGRPPTPAPPPPPELETLVDSWPAVVEFVRQGNAMLAATARGCSSGVIRTTRR